MENVDPNTKKRKTVEETYEKLEPREHILKRPDSYIGSIESDTQTLWVLDEATSSMVQRNVTFVPGLYKIFDEILVNAADNKQRDPNMDTLRVDVDAAAGTVTVYNNGRGIPCEIHKKHGVYVAEMIFGQLMAGENFRDDEKRTVGGRNGFGAKLANIYSTVFTVESQDQAKGLKYKQEFRKNMTETGKPVITSCDKPDWTKISFKPDLQRFGMASLDDDIVALMQKRVYDMAGTFDKGLKVFWNGERIKTAGFKNYVDLYLKDDKAVKVYEKVNDRWEVCVTTSEDGHAQQVSFVNRIWTINGGSHVNYVAEQVVKKVTEAVAKKNKGLPVKPAQIKNQLFVFVNCLIENPAFDSQTKTNLTTKRSSFGSKCELDEKFLKNVMKSGIVERAAEMAKLSATKTLTKTDGKKNRKVSGIAKLDDANDAGTKKASECALILTEGDSAKTLAVSGLSVVGRDKFGVFPLKGKVLNVRDASMKAILGNAEITNLKQILGLKQGETYDDVSKLRYGRIIIMTDQDHDGSHIKGLLINMFAYFWPSLLKMDGFLTEFITPIVRCKKGNKKLDFYTLTEYTKWKSDNNDGKGWTIKYYKGLGTSTAAEAKEYFSDLDRHQLEFSYEGKADEDNIDMVFNKKKADARKEWLELFEPGTFLDQNVKAINYSDFINKELIHFSMASNTRAIPALMDGLKPGQRKILWSCFKRRLTKEIKVEQLVGYVSEHAAYHHGEASLGATIVGMAQNFVGNNNVNFLMPQGQFGTRLAGGKDSASPRYIFTTLAPVTRALFCEEDDAVLKYLNDDGADIEPEWYAPVIPAVLINGSAGIGTGWSSDIPNYNPRELIENIKKLIEGKKDEMIPLHPWYKGFTGEIVPATKKQQSYTVRGKIEKVNDTTLYVSELPLFKWTTDYKAFLEDLLNEQYIRDFRENHTDTTVSFTITITEEKMKAAEEEGLEKKFKMGSTVSTSNMVVFDAMGKLKKYENVNDILTDFYDVRLVYYTKRKEHMIERLTRELLRLDNKVRFILAVVSEELRIRNVKRDVILGELARQGYSRLPKESKKKESGSDESEVAENDLNEDSEEKETDSKKNARDFDYLLSMALWNLTMEKVEELKRQRKEKYTELEDLRGTSETALWLHDLDKLSVALDEHDAHEQEASSAVYKAKPRKKQAVRKHADDDDYDEKPKRKPAAPKPKPKAAEAMKVTVKPKVESKPKPAAKKAVVPTAKPVKKRPSKSDADELNESIQSVASDIEKMIDSIDSNDFTERRPKRERTKVNYAEAHHGSDDEGQLDDISSDFELEGESTRGKEDEVTKERAVDEEELSIPKSKAAKPKAAPKTKKPDIDDDDYEDEEEDNDDDDDDDDYSETPQKKPRKKIKAEPVEKKSKPAPKRKAVPKDDDEDNGDDADYQETPEKKQKKKKEPSEAKKKTKAAPKKKAAMSEDEEDIKPAKKQKSVEQPKALKALKEKETFTVKRKDVDFDESFMVDRNSPTSAPKADRPRRAGPAKTYAEVDESDGEGQVEVDSDFDGE